MFKNIYYILNNLFFFGKKNILFSKMPTLNTISQPNHYSLHIVTKVIKLYIHNNIIGNQ